MAGFLLLSAVALLAAAWWGAAIATLGDGTPPSAAKSAPGADVCGQEGALSEGDGEIAGHV